MTSTNTNTLTKATKTPAPAVPAVRGTGSALTALVSGSMVLAGRLCHCTGRVLGWAWEQASIDPEAQAAIQAHAKKTAKVRAKWAKKAAKADEEAQEDGEAEELQALGKAPSGRRPFPEALAYLALGGLLAAGAAGTVGALVVPYLHLLAPWKPVIVSVGGLAWMVAAWMLAPPPKPATADVVEGVVEGQEQEDVQEDQGDVADETDRGTALLWHVVRALADAESAGRAGLHLDTVLASATEAGFIPEGTELAELRAWVESAGLPAVDKLGMRIGGKPVTRVGLRVDAATEALGMTPTALLQARPETASGGAPAGPAQPVGETPAKAPANTPAEAPAPAVLRLIPGGRQAPSQAPSVAPSPALAQAPVQEAR
ncbi:hypothetical protein ACIPJG_33360 [Streptomyces halstedii]|uniref:hypothetical protein n=1 Tax=Streptomyces halstedii TaxID=1944 RepID=UPI0038265CCE